MVDPLTRFRIGSRRACLGSNHNRSIIFVAAKSSAKRLTFITSSPNLHIRSNLQVSLANSMLAFAYPLSSIGPETPADARNIRIRLNFQKAISTLPCHETEGDARLISIGARMLNCTACRWQSS